MKISFTLTRHFVLLLFCIVLIPVFSKANPGSSSSIDRKTEVGNKYIKVNFYSGNNVYSNAEWNNWSSAISKTFNALKYSDGSTSTINAVLGSSYGTADNGANYGGAMAPSEVLRYANYGLKRTLILSGLSTSKTYNLELYSSRGNTGNSTIFTIGTTTITIVTDYNQTDKAIFTDLVPNSTGQIVINIDKTGTYNFVNGFILTEIGDSAPPANQLPSANAGTDQNITLPASTVTLSGSGSDADGSITTYSWSQVSGPGTATLTNKTSATATAAGLTEGTYVFRLTVTDNSSATAYDDVSITVVQGTTVQLGVFSPNDPVVNYDAAHPPTKPASGQVGKWVRTPRLTWNTTAFKCYYYNNMAFRLKFPKNYDSTKSYPLLVFFHGLGEYGTIYDNEYQLYHGGQQHASAVDDGRFNGFLLYPQSTTEQWSTGNIANVCNLLEKVMIQQGLVDPFRVYVDGLSAGGNTAWTFLRKYTRLVAALTPISSANSAYIDSVQTYKYTPIYHFQGGLDTSPTPSAARSLGTKVLGYGSNYQYKEYPNRGHDCWYLAWAEPDYYPFYSRAHKANPWPLYGRTAFCQGESFRDTLGVTPGFDAYEWRKDGVLIAGATSNYIVATDFGTYDCRVKRGNLWSPWSPRPVVITVKPLTVQPLITTTGLASNVIPAPDGSNVVPLEVPDGYQSYSWIKEGANTVLSTTRFLKAATPGNYKVQVTEKNGCGIAIGVTTVPATANRIEAESFIAISGARAENCGDAGGGQDVGYIDLDDWMDYTINAPTSGNYAVKFRLASGATGAQFQVRTAGGLALATIVVPGTGNWQKYVDVTSTLYLKAGVQTLRLYSIAVPRFNINYFELTNPAGTSGTADGFSQPFLVVDANGTNAPDAATDVKATSASKYGVELNWSQNAAPAYNETGFEVYEATTADGPYTYRGSTGADATGTTIGNLTPGITYFYKVRAVNNYSAATVEAPATATTLADKTPPTTPAGLQVGTIGKTYVELLWTAATDDVGVAYYDVYVNGVKTYVVAGNLIKNTMYNLEANKDYTFYIIARDAAGNVSSGSNQVSAHTLSGSVTVDPSQGTNPKNYSVYINFNVDNPATAPWNNTNSLPAEGLVFKNLRTYGNNYSGVLLTLVNNFSGYNPGGMNTGNNSGVYPDNVMRSAYYCDKGVTATVQVSGLSVRHTYTFVFFGSRSGTGDRTSVYSIGNRSVSLNAANNTTQTVQLDNIVPDENGTVTYTVSLGTSALYAYQNALVIKGYSMDAPATATRLAAAAPVVTELPDSSSRIPLAQALPNPVAGTSVMIRVPLLQSTPELRLSLTDATGSVLKNWRFTGLHQGIWQQPLNLPAGAQQPGMYLLHITGLPNGKTQTLKILKEK